MEQHGIHKGVQSIEILPISLSFTPKELP